MFCIPRENKSRWLILKGCSVIDSRFPYIQRVGFKKQQEQYLRIEHIDWMKGHRTNSIASDIVLYIKKYHV